MAKNKVYAVVKGRAPGLYDTWFGSGGAEEQIKGFTGAIFKGFGSRSEAQTWFRKVSEGGRAAMRDAAAPTRKKRADAGKAPSGSTEYLRRQAQALESGKTVIYTDGGCEGNPGVGGFGAVILRGTEREEVSGGFAHTTNNRMELMACIVSLEAMSPESDVVLFSDSAYTINGIEKGWAVRWRANGWQRREGNQLIPAKNADLWARLLDLCDQNNVVFVKVKGHAGVPENERCDEISTEMMQRDDLLEDSGFDG